MNNHSPRAFLRRIRYRMAQRDISQAELARRVHTTSSTVNAWFRDDSPTLPDGRTMLRLPKALDHCSDAWLFAGIGHPDAKPDEGFSAGVRWERERVRRALDDGPMPKRLAVRKSERVPI